MLKLDLVIVILIRSQPELQKIYPTTKRLELDSFKDYSLKLGIQYKTKEPFAQNQSIHRYDFCFLDLSNSFLKVKNVLRFEY